MPPEQTDGDEDRDASDEEITSSPNHVASVLHRHPPTRVMPEFGSRPKRYGAIDRRHNRLGVSEMSRFLCDEMLHGLGRWLRAAGYDTVIAKGGLSDQELAARCAGENRILLTKDRYLAATAAGIAPVVLVQGNGIDETARALRAALDIDWQYAPFSRCMIDNRPLESALPYLATHVPERSRAAGGPLRMCPECGRLYWSGGHVRRMQQRLAAWQQEETPPS